MSAKNGRSSRPIWLGQDNRTWDHVRVHLQLLQDKRLGAYELGVYFGLVAHAETNSGKCYPAAATLAKYLNCNEKTVRRAVKTLIEAGYVRVKHNDGKASHYFVLAPPTLDSDTALTEDNPGTTVQGSGLTYRATPDSGTDEQEPITRTINKKKSEDSYPQIGPQRFIPPEEQHSCDLCEPSGGKWVERDDGTVEPCPNLYKTELRAVN